MGRAMHRCIELASLAAFAAIVSVPFTMPEDGSGCNMTYMYPAWRKERVKGDSGEFEEHNYGLFRYLEKDKEPRHRESPRPVLFVAGNAGSYRQVRSVASVVANGGLPLDVFSVDYDEELSALNGDVGMRQVRYLALVAEQLCAAYQSPDVYIVSHSMGGIIAAAAASELRNCSFPLIVMLSTPLAQPPLLDDPGMRSLYGQAHRNLDAASAGAAPRLVVSLSGGIRDVLVPSSNTLRPPPAGGGAAFYAAVATHELFMGAGCDHLAMAWCNQVVGFVGALLKEAPKLRTDPGPPLPLLFSWKGAHGRLRKRQAAAQEFSDLSALREAAGGRQVACSPLPPAAAGDQGGAAGPPFFAVVVHKNAAGVVAARRQQQQQQQQQPLFAAKLLTPALALFAAPAGAGSSEAGAQLCLWGLSWRGAPAAAGDAAAGGLLLFARGFELTADVPYTVTAARSPLAAAAEQSFGRLGLTLWEAAERHMHYSVTVTSTCPAHDAAVVFEGHRVMPSGKQGAAAQFVAARLPADGTPAFGGGDPSTPGPPFLAVVQAAGCETTASVRPLWRATLWAAFLPPGASNAAAAAAALVLARHAVGTVPAGHRTAAAVGVHAVVLARLPLLHVAPLFFVPSLLLWVASLRVFRVDSRAVKIVLIVLVAVFASALGVHALYSYIAAFVMNLCFCGDKWVGAWLLLKGAHVGCLFAADPSLAASHHHEPLLLLFLGSNLQHRAGAVPSWVAAARMLAALAAVFACVSFAPSTAAVDCLAAAAIIEAAVAMWRTAPTP
ncbi:GPI inositol-deacylase [Diplonema papillatum]|nr:GPI inositol-deacylase [Diplonema papillatum]